MYLKRALIMQLGTREIRHIILNNQVVNSFRALHSLKHTVPKSHKNIAIHMVDHIRRLGVFPANYALDLGEFIDSNGNSYIDIVELNPISCSIVLHEVVAMTYACVPIGPIPCDEVNSVFALNSSQHSAIESGQHLVAVL